MRNLKGSKLLGFFLISFFVFSLCLAVPDAQSKIAVGVSWSERGAANNPSPKGLIGKIDLGKTGAIQGTLQHSAGDLVDYTQLRTEFQINVDTRKNARFYTGGGLDYTSQSSFPDDPISIYAPIGFEYSISESPVSLTASSSFEYVLENGAGGSGIEFFDDVTIGAIYYFK